MADLNAELDRVQGRRGRSRSGSPAPNRAHRRSPPPEYESDTDDEVPPPEPEHDEEPPPYDNPSGEIGRRQIVCK